MSQNEIPKNFKIVLPGSLRQSLLTWAHSKIIHHGQYNILQRIKNYWWPYYRKDVASYTNSCDACQKIKPNKYKKYQTTVFSCDTPFEIISIDITGPYPTTDKDNRYIITIIDKFTRLCYFLPVKMIKSIDIIMAIESWSSNL